MAPKHYEALRNAKFYKFYPTHPKIEVRPHIDPFINRYYGKAHYVFPKVPDLPNPADNNNSINNNNNNSKAEEKPKTTPSTVAAFVPPVSTGFVPPPTSGGFVFSGFAPNPVVEEKPSGFKPPSGFTLGSTTAPTVQSFVAPTDAPVTSGGFTMGSGFTFAAPVVPKGTWKCAACDSDNAPTSKKCSICLTPKL